MLHNNNNIKHLLCSSYDSKCSLIYYIVCHMFDFITYYMKLCVCLNIDTYSILISFMRLVEYANLSHFIYCETETIFTCIT